jgi:hypothetical protein
MVAYNSKNDIHSRRREAPTGTESKSIRRSVLSFNLVLVTAVIVVLLIWAEAVSLRQDIGAYRTNLYAGVVGDSFKSAWYNYFLFPLRGIVTSVDLALRIVQVLIAILMTFSLRKGIQSWRDIFFASILIAIVPSMSDNHGEYLRQGSALALFMLAISIQSWPARLVIMSLSVIAHGVALYWIFCAFTPIVLFSVYRRFVRREHLHSRRAFSRRHWIRETAPAWSLSAAIIVSIVMASFTVVGYFSLFNLAAFIPADYKVGLSGARTNLLGAAYLFTYGVYVGVVSLKRRSAPHWAVFVGAIVMAAAYGNLTDYGRAISLIVPLHVMATFTIDSRAWRALDFLAVAILGSLWLLA